MMKDVDDDDMTEIKQEGSKVFIWLGNVVVMASDSWSGDRELDSQPVYCKVA